MPASEDTFIRILGTRGEIPLSAPKHKNHSGVLIDGRFLFDLGELKFLREKPEAVFITHLHPDHAAFVREPFTPPSIPIYAPEKGSYPFLQKAVPFVSGPYRITPIPTVHSRKVRSCAYLIEKGEKRILYTSDIAWMEAAYRKKLPPLDAVITEASAMREGGILRKDPSGKLYGHAGIPNLVRMWKPHTSRIIFTHFGSWFCKDVKKGEEDIAALAHEEGIDVVIAYDGQEIII